MTFKANHSATSLGVCRPDGFWPCDGRHSTKQELVIDDCSFFYASADDSREDYDRLVQEIKDKGHSAAINEYQKGDKWQNIYLNTDCVEKITVGYEHIK